MEKHSTTNAFIIKNGFSIREISVLMEKSLDQQCIDY